MGSLIFHHLIYDLKHLYFEPLEYNQDFAFEFRQILINLIKWQEY